MEDVDEVGAGEICAMFEWNVRLVTLLPTDCQFINDPDARA